MKVVVEIDVPDPEPEAPVEPAECIMEPKTDLVLDWDENGKPVLLAGARPDFTIIGSLDMNIDWAGINRPMFLM